MMRKSHLLLKVSFLLFAIPVGLALTRSSVMDLYVHHAGIDEIHPAGNSEISCDLQLCSKSTQFNISPSIHDPEAPLSIGYYGAFSDSWVNTPARTIDKVLTRQDLQLSWFKFKSYRLEPNRDYSGVHSEVAVVSVTPRDSKKLGMSAPSLFVGTPRAIDGLKQVYEFYKLHLYVLLALFLLGIKLFLFASKFANEKRGNSNMVATWITVFALLSYSHYLDPILINFGVSQSFVEGFARILWGPAILLQMQLRRWQVACATAAYLIAVGPGLIDWPLRDIFFAGFYKWAVTSITVITAFQVCRPKLRSKMLQHLPFVALLLTDTLMIQDWLPLGKYYLSPFGLFALPILRNLEDLISIIEHHYFWHQKEKISAELARLRTATSTASAQEWKDLLFRIAQQLSRTTNATRISICYLGLESPLIVGIRNTERIEFDDGTLPPVFARVIQTSEEYWWVGKADLSAVLTHTNFRNSLGNYQADFATVLPILADNEVYGALSLTDFANPKELIENSEFRKHTGDIINSYRDLLSIKLVKNRERSVSVAEKVSSILAEGFSERAPYTNNPKAAADVLLDLITENLPVRAMYFEYHQDTERLQLLASSQMEAELLNIWTAIPFRARITNRLSPFAIAINEKRTVVIEDIRIYYSLLAEISVEALEAAGGRGFVAHPVMSGEKVLGLICLLQIDLNKSFLIDFRKGLGTASGYLAYQIESFRAANRVRDAERTIARFADPSLVKALSTAPTKDAIIAGHSFEGAIVIQDMRGSTQASRRVNDPADLAARLSKIYGKAATLAQHYGGSFEKGNGDGLITTLGTGTSNHGALSLCFQYLNEVFHIAKDQLQIRETVVIAHRGTLFKGVMGHLHRIAWDTCGSDLVDAFTIEKHAKIHDRIIFAVSSQFLSAELDETKSTIHRLATTRFAVEGISGEVYFFNRADAEALREQLSLTVSRARAA